MFSKPFSSARRSWQNTQCLNMVGLMRMQSIIVLDTHQRARLQQISFTRKHAKTNREKYTCRESWTHGALESGNVTQQGVTGTARCNALHEKVHKERLKGDSAVWWVAECCSVDPRIGRTMGPWWSYWVAAPGSDFCGRWCLKTASFDSKHLHISVIALVCSALFNLASVILGAKLRLFSLGPLGSSK